MSTGVKVRCASLNRGALRGPKLPISLLTLALLAAPLLGKGQTAGINQGGPDYVHAPAGSMPQTNTSQSSSTIDQMRQAERHKRIAEDTAKLYVLSAELKLAVDQSSKDQLSLDILKKASEIEKLAHDIKQWTKY